MEKNICCACDLHDKSLVLKIGRGRAEAVTRRLPNSSAGREALKRLLDDLRRKEGFERVVFAYEASGQGYGLYDEMKEAGFESYVLAPSLLSRNRSAKQRKNKNDEKDAELILEHLRGHVLGGNRLASIWVPPPAIRDDRDLCRARQDTQQKCSRVKTQIRCLLKRNDVSKPAQAGQGWTMFYRAWLRGQTKPAGAALGPGARAALRSLLRQLEFYEAEVAELDRHIAGLAASDRHRPVVEALKKKHRVGTLTALAFVVQLGDMRRFANRRKVGNALGLTPSANESGNAGDRKGHITRQGSPWIRHLLCQGVWNRLRVVPEEREYYDRLVARNPKKKKVAVTACMRRLGVGLWHTALEVQQAMQAEAAG